MAVFLDMLGVTYEAQKPFPGIGIVDFYIPEQRIAVEADGTYWHEKEETKRSDAKKDRSLKARGVEVIRVPGTDLDPREGRTPVQRQLKLAGGR
jgi:very-short-patch-repair endonuclease